MGRRSTSRPKHDLEGVRLRSTKPAFLRASLENNRCAREIIVLADGSVPEDLNRSEETLGPKSANPSVG